MPEPENTTEKRNVPDGFTCPSCRKTSYNPRDAQERYCGNCHKITDDPGFVDMDGNPIDGKTWSAQFEVFQSRVIARDRVADSLIFTVWVGTVIPVIDVYPFGTGLTTGDSTSEIAQYWTKEAAAAGHAAILAWLQANPSGTFTDQIRTEVVPDSEPAK